MQQAALGKGESAVSEWLEGNDLLQHQRLAEGIEVESGWERAVECVLGAYLQAVCVEGIDPLAAMLGELDKGALTLFDPTVSTAVSESQPNELLGKVSSQWPLQTLLAGVLIADDLQAAMAIRGTLLAHQSVITPEGIWMGPNWLRVVRDQDAQAGVLQREQELKQLSDELALLAEQLESLEQEQLVGHDSLRELEASREALQHEHNRFNATLADIRSQLSARQARLEQRRNRIEQICHEREELAEQVLTSRDSYQLANQKLSEALAEVDQLTRQREVLTKQRDDLRQALDHAREHARNVATGTHELELRLQSMRASLHSTEQGLGRIQDQLQHLEQRSEELRDGLEQGEELELLKEELEEKLQLRIEVEAELATVRAKVDEIEHTLRELNTERVQLDHQLQGHRSGLEQLRINAQELRVRRQTMLEKIHETGLAFPQLFDEMPQEADEKAWQEQVESIENRIKRLGPINLAAIDEYQEQSERKRYLDEQNDDLCEALETLEAAIAKIDRETRSRFKETFEKVNSGLQANFPKLFGGGHAYLELTGDDLLSTGVTVMARPPGKRNSTIHLLSGGEKALTAVALVFSIFELNPAPFCMLDEVDAPLDEANVGRFCKMVKEMSEQVQFIFISHNKATMEMANQLNGVTMSEPGVSRLVAVDIEEAVELASA